jgi:hypothetical protein
MSDYRKFPKIGSRRIILFPPLGDGDITSSVPLFSFLSFQKRPANGQARGVDDQVSPGCRHTTAY